MPSSNARAAVKPSSARALSGEDDMADVPEPIPAGHHRIGPPVGDRQGVRHLADGMRLTARHVVRRRRANPAHGQHVGPRHITDVDEVPPLATVLEHLRRHPIRSAERKIAATPAYGVSRGIRGPYTLW
jgi:hypothetical protein